MLPAESDFYLYYWDLWKGLRVVHADTLQEQAALPDTASFMAALEHINAFLKQAQQAGVFIFAHTRPVWAASPAFSLAFEDLLKRMNWAYQGPARIVLCGSTGDLPPMIANMVSRLDLPYPGLAEIKAHLSATTGLAPADLPPALVDAMRGLSHRQAMMAARQAGTRRSNLEEAVSVITDAKISLLESTAPFTRFMPVAKQSPPLVGIDNLENYTEHLRAVLAHPELGVSPGGGILLLGQPGTGKSTFVRFLSHRMQLPVLVFNFADVMGSLVGESEGRMKKVIQATNAIGPVIVQMDEIEKQMPSMKGQASDGGLGTRLVGMILPWMQEVFDENRPVIFVATSNLSAIHNLPPEFISRFMVFKIDEPDPASLAEIFRVHLASISKAAYDTPALAKALIETTQGRRPVGRDVVQIIRSAQAASVARCARSSPDMQDLLEAIKGMREGMVALDGGNGIKIYAKPVCASRKDTRNQPAIPTNLRFGGLPDISQN